MIITVNYKQEIKICHFRFLNFARFKLRVTKNFNFLNILDHK